MRFQLSLGHFTLGLNLVKFAGKDFDTALKLVVFLHLQIVFLLGFLIFGQRLVQSGLNFFDLSILVGHVLAYFDLFGVVLFLQLPQAVLDLPELRVLVFFTKGKFVQKSLVGANFVIVIDCAHGLDGKLLL